MTKIQESKLVKSKLQIMGFWSDKGTPQGSHKNIEFFNCFWVGIGHTYYHGVIDIDVDEYVTTGLANVQEVRVVVLKEDDGKGATLINAAIDIKECWCEVIKGEVSMLPCKFAFELEH